MDVSKIYLIPHRHPVMTGHRSFHNRTLLFSPIDNGSKHYAFKGVGTNEFNVHYPKDFGRMHHSNYAYIKEEKMIERQFWGGARHVSNLHAAKWSRAAIDELAKMESERDPALAVAESYGGKINIMNPYAIFKPLQVPILSLKPKGKVVKIEHSEGMEKSGIPESLAKSHTILAYTAPKGATIRLKDADYFDTPSVRTEEHMAVGASMGLMLHILHNRMKLYGGDKNGGTIFHPNNVSVEPNGNLSFFDFDTINDTSRINRLTDLRVALNSIQHSVRSVYVKPAIIAMLDVYTVGMSRRRMSQVIREIGKAGKFIGYKTDDFRDIKQYLRSKMPPRKGIRDSLKRLFRKHP
ncbi:MAG: hypothetical protein ABIG96_04460 [Candidatus Micrarchaeota archaeon]